MDTIRSTGVSTIPSKSTDAVGLTKISTIPSNSIDINTFSKKKGKKRRRRYMSIDTRGS